MKAIIDRLTYNGSGGEFEVSKDRAGIQYLTCRLRDNKGAQVVVFTVNSADLIDALKMFKC